MLLLSQKILLIEKGTRPVPFFIWVKCKPKFKFKFNPGTQNPKLKTRMELTARIEQLLAEKFSTDADFNDCFLVETKLGAGKLLEVFVDSDGPMDFKRCQRISRFLEADLDEHKWLGEEYTLEVSSPGIGRPLKFARQYVKNIGRTVEITLLDGSVETGVLTTAKLSNSLTIIA